MNTEELVIIFNTIGSSVDTIAKLAQAIHNHGYEIDLKTKVFPIEETKSVSIRIPSKTFYPFKTPVLYGGSGKDLTIKLKDD